MHSCRFSRLQPTIYNGQTGVQAQVDRDPIRHTNPTDTLNKHVRTVFQGFLLVMYAYIYR